MKIRTITTLILLSLLFTQCDDDQPADYGIVGDDPTTDSGSGGSGGNVESGDISYELIDSQASANTKLLAENLRQSAKSGFFVGQQQAYIDDRDVSPRTFITECDMFNISEKYPLVTGEDFLVLTNDDYTATNWYGKQSAAHAEWVKECYKMGVFTTFSWHFREPYAGESFYVSDMDSDSAAKAFKSILEGGENHEYYKAKLDIIANFCKNLIADDGELIPIIFRPFHEHNSSWFWWGIPYYATADEFIQNWRFTVEYLRDTCDVHNIIYSYSPSGDLSTEAAFLECYPGNDYVDMVGFDTYEDYSKGATAKQTTTTELKVLQEFTASRGKIAALTECGYDLVGKSEVTNLYTDYFMGVVEDSGVEIAYMLFWYNSDAKDFTPSERSSSAMISNFKTFLSDQRVYMMDSSASPLSTDF